MPYLSRRAFGLGLSAVGFSQCPAIARADAACSMPPWAVKLRANLERMAVDLTVRLKPWTGPKQVATPEQFGYRAGDALATLAIQAAIDSLAARGGGTVRLTDGDYVSGTIDLRDNIRLDIGRDARLLGSLDLQDWPERVARRRTVQDTNMGMNQSLIFAERRRNISLSGSGTIDGRGASFHGAETSHGTPGRPFLIRIIDCQDIHITGLTLKDSPCWMQNYLNCDDLLIEQLSIDNQANWNNDGCDIDGCRNVIVRHCHISSGDDAMCFKGAAEAPTENVLVENCTFYTSCNALKLGTDSQSVFRNVLARHLKLAGVTEDMRHIKPVGANSGISWEVVDGGHAENILCTDISITNARSPLFMRLDNRGRVRPDEPKPEPGTLRRVVFERITGRDNGPRGSYFIGIPARRIQDVVVRDVNLGQRASSKPVSDEASIPEMYNRYPDAEMLNSVGGSSERGAGADAPAYGLWARHIEGLTLISYRVTPDGPDPRPRFKVDLDASDICGAANSQ